MLLLLDSNVLFRLIYEPGELSVLSGQAIRDPRNRLLVSHATLWESLAKVYRGNMLVSDQSFESEVQLVRQLGAEFVFVTLEDILTCIALPDVHRDPFDRMLIAQAKRLQAMIVSSDRELRLYGVPVIPL